MSQRVLSLLAAGEKLDWVPDQPHRSLEGGYSPHMEEIILYLKVCAWGPAGRAAGPLVVGGGISRSAWHTGQTGAAVLEPTRHGGTR